MTPQTASGEALCEDIQRWARELGFEQVGIAGVDLSGQEPNVRCWLERGFNGEMGYLERNVEKRLHPAAPGGRNLHRDLRTHELSSRRL